MTGEPKGPRFSRHEAHPFQPTGDDPARERCRICGERREQIRHHPTRVRAACLLRGIDPDTVLGELG